MQTCYLLDIVFLVLVIKPVYNVDTNMATKLKLKKHGVLIFIAKNIRNKLFGPFKFYQTIL